MPVLLDGAQGVGAIPSTCARSAATPTRAPGRSGCAARTAPGCCTSARPCASACRSTRRGYANLADPNAGLRRAAARGRAALRRDVAERRGARLRAGGDRLLEAAGWAPCTRARARSPRAWPSCSPSADARSAPRGATTLVSFASADPAGRARAAGRARRDRAQHPRTAVAARVGRGWNDEDDLRRLSGGSPA